MQLANQVTQVKQVTKIKNLTEDLFIDVKGIFPGIYTNHKYNSKTETPYNRKSWIYNPTMTIQRNLRDDTFNVRLKLDKHLHFNFNTNFQIDGKTITDNMPIHDHSIKTDVVNDILHHSLIRDAKFSNTKSIAAGLVLKSESWDDHLKFVNPRYSRKDLGAFLIVINNLVKNQNISVTSDDIIHIKTINSIKVTKDEPLYIWLNSKKFSNDLGGHLYKIMDPDDQNDQNVSFEYSYNHLYLKPLPISRYKHNTKIYDVFMSNDDGTPIIGDMNIKNGIMSTSETGNSKMQIGFYSELHEPKEEIIDGESRKYIGYYALEDYSYFDYESNKTIFGPSSNSKIGDLVPYNLGGNYMRQIQMSLNCDYDALKIYESKKFNEPMLKPFVGTIKIYLEKKDFNNLIKMQKISKININNIKNNFDDYKLKMVDSND